MSAGTDSTPEGFCWARDTQGKPILRPTREHVTSLAATCTTWLENADGREILLHRDAIMHAALANTIERIDTEQRYAPLMEMARYIASLGDAAPDRMELRKRLTRALRRLDAVNVDMATNIAKALVKQAGHELAGALFWMQIAARDVLNHRNALREDAAERSLLMYESSRTQALIAAQIVDWGKDNDVSLDAGEAAQCYLDWQGWELANQHTVVDRAT